MNRGTDDRLAASSRLQRGARSLKRLGRAILLVLAFYLVVVLVGLIPVNNDFQPTPDGIEILFVSSAIHADVVLPIETDTINWREHFPPDSFSGDTRGATHVAIGWGDRAFFIGTPNWADLRFSAAAKALLWPSDTCMHVHFTNAEPLRHGARSVTISAAQYERLVEFINASFKRDGDGSPIQIQNAAYGSADAFFQAHGAYHCFNTCNCWMGRCMQSAGIRTGWFTPLPKSVFLFLPE